VRFIKRPLPGGNVIIRRCFIFFLFCFLIVLTPTKNLMAGTLHAIFVGDTLKEMADITRPDMERWQKEVKIISKYTKMGLQQKVFVGRQFNKNDVSLYLQRLSLKKEDAVIFYFSGHGYRTMDQKSPLPTLTFQFYEPGIEMQWVVDKIRNKKPRYALIMSDCCNNYLERGFNNPTKKIQIKLRLNQPNYFGYDHLFGKAKGCIVISSCSAGQFSYGSHFGGLYTQCFFACLNRELKEEKPSWRNLLRRCNGYIGHIQRPIVQIFKG
jgi:hypothetical protein